MKIGTDASSLGPLLEKPARSFFLWGPRQTGKSALLHARYPGAHWIDLLDTDALVRFTQRPALLREEVAALPRSGVLSSRGKADRVTRMAGIRPWPKLRNPGIRRDRSVEERARALEQACRAAMQMLAGSPDRAARLRRIDPVPHSTLALFRRLRAARDG